jgi:hypothetical protein
MKPLHQFRKTASLLRIALLLAFRLTPHAEAVVPLPDGGYPNFTTAEGTNALQNLTTGAANTGIGWRSLFSDSAGSFNTGVGGGALLLNNADSNTAVGAAALLLNTSGTENTAVGTGALVNNDTGDSNTANGSFALFSNIQGNRNTAIGFHALENNIASSNIAVGADALRSNTTGINNIAVGNTSLEVNIGGSGNTAVGSAALTSKTQGDGNTGIGNFSLASNTEGSANTAVGQFALAFNTKGDFNTAVGGNALDQSTGSQNTALGHRAGTNMTTADNVICIGTPGDATAFALGDRCFIGNIRGATVGNGDGVNVIIDSDGQLGTINSSRRFKKDIKSMDQTSEAILALKPVTFHYKNQDTKKAESTPQFGLIAEDVAEANPDLVVRDRDGKPFTVRYDAVNAMLLNEFLKAHRKVQELEANAVKQQKQIDALTAGLQKVSAQLGLSKAAPLIANNP